MYQSWLNRNLSPFINRLAFILFVFIYQFSESRNLDLRYIESDNQTMDKTRISLPNNSLLQYCIDQAMSYNANILASESDILKANLDYQSMVAANITPTVIFAKGFGRSEETLSIGLQTKQNTSSPNNQALIISLPLFDTSLLAQLPLLDDTRDSVLIQSDIVKNRVALAVTNSFITLVNESFKQDELAGVINYVEHLEKNFKNISSENKTYIHAFKINILSAIQRSKIAYNNAYIDNKRLTGIADKSIFSNIAKDITSIARDLRYKLKIPKTKEDALSYVNSYSPELKSAQASSNLAIDMRRLKLLSGLFNASLDITPYSEAAISQDGFRLNRSDKSIMLNLSVRLNIFSKALTYQAETANIEKFRHLIESEVRAIDSEIEKMYEPTTGFLDIAVGILKDQTDQFRLLQKSMTHYNTPVPRQEDTPSIIGKMQSYAQLINEISDEYSAILLTQARFKAMAGLLSDLSSLEDNNVFNYDPIGNIIPIVEP